MYKKYFMLGVVYLFWGWYMMIPNEKVKVIFCNVGQGDATLITSGYFQMLIDTGPIKGSVEQCLDENMPFGDKKLEVVLLSHFDSDHRGALENLKKYYQIGRLDNLTTIFAGDKIVGNNFVFKAIYPFYGLQQRNNDSVVGILEYENKNILFTGDIDEIVENSIINSIDRPIDVVKLSHHGSKTGNSEAWLSKVNAKYAVISVGKNNYGHPNAEVIGRVLGVGTSVLRTDENGSLIVE